MSVDRAACRPGEGRHNIWEIAVHAAYWKYVVRRAITGEKRGLFPCKGSNWFARNGSDAAAWGADLNLLANEHRQLRAAVAGFDPKKLAQSAGRGKFTYAALIRGIAAHDLYHAGQIQLLKRLPKELGA